MPTSMVEGTKSESGERAMDTRGRLIIERFDIKKWSEVLVSPKQGTTR